MRARAAAGDGGEELRVVVDLPARVLLRRPQAVRARARARDHAAQRTPLRLQARLPGQERERFLPRVVGPPQFAIPVPPEERVCEERDPRRDADGDGDLGGVRETAAVRVCCGKRTLVAGGKEHVAGRTRLLDRPGEVEIIVRSELLVRPVWDLAGRRHI